MMTTVPLERLEAAYQTALAALLKERSQQGHWVGELSTSALSTATAVMALYLVQKHAGTPHQGLIEGGLAWLTAHQNDDGGWGDTTVSISNISTTMLCRAAIYLTQSTPRLALAVSRAEAWLSSKYGPPEKWPEAVRQRYGKDRTFATPILTTCALAGLVTWDEVPLLPFELACLPQAWFRLVRLHVVSYALPALIAIGQCIYQHKKPWNPIARVIRALSRKRSLRVLQAIQPSSGGFLEAIPLTSFVTLSLAACGLALAPVTQSAVRFLVNAVRPDGSWAIDSNLATWVTTLSINALAAAGELDRLDRKDELRDWLLKQQYMVKHPYTGADPGGWAWTDLPGGVPDGDDTPGVMLALRNLLAIEGKGFRDLSTFIAIDRSYSWLFHLQNSDGGWPTFCRGWSNLPFDRSGADLTAHALRALSLWDSMGEIEGAFVAPIFDGGAFMKHGLRFLARTQRPDGSWLPLWFGNQHMPDDENLTYGTARVLAAYRDLGMMDTEPARKGIAWLTRNQNLDGGWGGGKDTPSSIEETALALDAIVDVRNATESVNKGLAWLVEQVEQGGLSHPTPIGFYFAKLWYFEKLYPIIFAVSALGRARKSIPPRMMPIPDSL
jgi:squalene-hopene/tetraprenyl-beta-curcumene cyclase